MNDSAPLSTDSLIALIFLAIVALAALLVGFFWLAGKLGWLDDGQPAPASVKPSTAAPAVTYGKPAAAPAPARVASVTSHREAEAEGKRKLDPEAMDGFITLTEKALQERDAERIEEGMVRMFAIFERRGLIPPRGASELKEAAFGVSGGRRLQKLNARIDAVAAQVAAPPAEPAEPPARTPLVGRAVPAGVAFPDDDA